MEPVGKTFCLLVEGPLPELQDLPSAELAEVPDGELAGEPVPESFSEPAVEPVGESESEPLSRPVKHTALEAAVRPAFDAPLAAALLEAWPVSARSSRPVPGRNRNRDSHLFAVYPGRKRHHGVDRPMHSPNTLAPANG